VTYRRLSADERRTLRTDQERRRLEEATIKAKALGGVAEAAETLSYAHRRFRDAAVAAHKHDASLHEIATAAAGALKEIPGYSRASLGTKLKGWRPSDCAHNSSESQADERCAATAMTVPDRKQ
jgi:hypothetical protein